MKDNTLMMPSSCLEVGVWMLGAVVRAYGGPATHEQRARGAMPGGDCQGHRPWTVESCSGPL